MLERIEKVLELNDISYESGKTRMYIKLGGLSSQVKISYDYATNTYKVNCGELRHYLISLFFFCQAVNMFYQPNLEVWAGYAAGLMLGIAFGNLLSVISANIQLLDLRAQLREEGVFLKLSS
ncbi:hypothetical protein [Vibrio mediterranei]|uniref:Uncharacterized protein n=1 Tax=Vibrio mediterranei TaxID=689 RepID=A0AAN1FHP1_9VIBR|nr:hypothetical protein [Vibrio mediterranei]ASI90812.1 hypothetical protein BSZ05_14010 [Vibrio mediterranei]